MALTVGTDTYISQADATTYMAGHYATTEAKHIAWDALASDDKDAYLRRALQIIDRQPVVGIKALPTQTLAFPRVIYSDAGPRFPATAYPFYGPGWYAQTEVPQTIMDAQVEMALELMTGISKRVELQRQGVKSFSLGKLSENYGSGNKNALPYEVRELMAPFLLGGAAMC